LRLHLKLLEKLIDGGKHFRGVGWLGFLAIGRVEGSHGHGRLFRRALISVSDCLRVLGNPLHHAHREIPVVLHVLEPLGKAHRDGLGGGGCVDHRLAVRSELAHFFGNRHQVLVELFRGGRIDLLGHQAEQEVPRVVPSRVARPILLRLASRALLAHALLTPAFQSRSQRMVTGKAG